MPGDAFLAFDDAPALTVLQRSETERWVICPFQAKAIEDGKVTVWPVLPVNGEEIHQALSRTAIAWVESQGAMSASDLRDCIEAELMGSRPDLQPDVIAGFRASIYAWAAMLHDIHPDNIIGLDGGDVIGRSGQLSMDLKDLGVRLTSEIDLLHSGDSVDVIHEKDYKTGWKNHTAGDVAKSYQFQFHAALAFENFPNIKALEVVVWNTRMNRPTHRVEFPREKDGQYRARIRMALQARMQHYETPETWPTQEKCSNCPAVMLCPVSGEPIRSVAQDPAAALTQLVALEAKADWIRKLLTAHVDNTRQDIVADGVAFGRRKKSERKAPANVYEVGGELEFD